jgi:hypothetical protein
MQGPAFDVCVVSPSIDRPDDRRRALDKAAQFRQLNSSRVIPDSFPSGNIRGGAVYVDRHNRCRRSKSVHRHRWFNRFNRLGGYSPSLEAYLKVFPQSDDHSYDALLKVISGNMMYKVGKVIS